MLNRLVIGAKEHLRSCFSCSTTLTSGALSRECHTMPHFVVFSGDARPDICAMRMLGDFIHSVVNTTEALLESGWNIGLTMTR